MRSHRFKPSFRPWPDVALGRAGCTSGRTHTLHDPVRWKYQHIGRALLHETAPPLHGVI
ncbi:hypothetical protein [Nocardia lijiangensis]|uniref:hypothetical protein n=1 Tax=Nocardia lijiangensis TaxID=299618 RepID=UPI000A8944C8|nr:hypothetical protein [Nocardia lijiangensis]